MTSTKQSLDRLHEDVSSLTDGTVKHRLTQAHEMVSAVDDWSGRVRETLKGAVTFATKEVSSLAEVSE